MADKEIGALPDGGALATGDVVHVVRSGNSRRAMAGNAAGKSVGTGSGDVASGDHVHDDRYYLQSTLDTAFAGKVDVTFLTANYYDKAALDTAFAGKAAIVGTPVDNQLAVWTTSGAVEGVAGLTYDGTDLMVDANITNLRDITFRTGATGGTIRTGTSAADKFVLQAYDVNDVVYRTVMELDAGNTVILQLRANYLEIDDDTDGTKKVRWAVSGATTATATTLAFGQTTDRTITFPDLTGTIALTSGAQTLTDKTLADPLITGTIREDVHPILDGAGFAIDPRNGSIQTLTLTASRTPVAANFNAGDSVTLMIADGSAYTITWSTVGVVWVGGTAPTLATTGYTVIELWKVGSTIYGSSPGAVA